MEYQFTKEFALKADESDPLKEFRKEFVFPQFKGTNCVYFTGNSLGLQAKKARQYANEEFDDWGTFGVEGHVESRRPWLHYHEFFTDSLAKIVGAKKTEVVAMNGLTTNLHLMMASFYRPAGKRVKIVCEGKAFPSDQYALRSQLRFHGLDASNLIEIEPDPITELISEDQVLEVLDTHADEIALVMLGGVNYYTGQLFNLEAITRKGKEIGAMVGWDLAHAAGNVILKLHDWDVDFAAWCGYKYLNSGPGGVSGVFVHEKHHDKPEIPRFEGWWGHDKRTRFVMPEDFVPIPTAEAWQLSNAPVFAMVPLLASLELFDKAGMEALRAKSERLTAYLDFVLAEVKAATGVPVKSLTPTNPVQRGSQISVVVPKVGRKVFDYLSKNGVMADWREPDVIRIAPVPMYNNFEDIFRFGELMIQSLNEIK